MLHAALTGSPLQWDLLYQAVRRNRAEQRVTLPRAALIKLVLLSQVSHTKEEEYMVQLDPNHPNPAYHCGRLLAVLEQAQRLAVPGINATIVDRFYGTASSAPASVFSRLMRGVQPHLAKLQRDQRGAYFALQQRLEEILGAVPEFPKTLTLEGQGLFTLGYYHQRAHDRTQAREAAVRRRQGLPGGPAVTCLRKPWKTWARPKLMIRRNNMTTTMQAHLDVNRRHDFVLLFEVTDGNPNGDPDPGNLPRVDPETMQGLVTDVCLKRKVRDWVDVLKGAEDRFKIYVQSGSEALNVKHRRAYAATGLTSTGTRQRVEDVERARQWMCDNFYDIGLTQLRVILNRNPMVLSLGNRIQLRNSYDIRLFGAVMTTGVNCGQVRGPVQLTFARSIDPIVPLDLSSPGLPSPGRKTPR